jgi:NAD+ kinase
VLKRVGFVVHGGQPLAKQTATAAADVLTSAGVDVVACADDGWHVDTVESRDASAFAEGVDMVVVFGGDGTFLRAAYLARDDGIPLLGVNLGRLGFLSEVESGKVAAALKQCVAGDFTVEERMTLAVTVHDGGGNEAGRIWALNDASVERVVPQRLITLEVCVGQGVFARVPADALICSTPTGSTAYAFSAGGPILSPLVDAILLVPVAPHALFDRTLVIDPRESLALRPIPGSQCVVSLDGRESLEVPTEGSVQVTRGDQPVRMARLGPFDFYGRVREKFNLQ